MATPRIPFATLITQLADPDDQVRRKAIQQIMRRRNERAQAFLPLAQLTSDPAYSVRKQAVRALGALGDSRAFPYLERALKTRPWNIRLAVVEALAKLGATPQSTAQAATLLNNMLMNDAIAQVRQAALNGLLKVRAPFTLQELLDAMVGTSQELRDHAVRALSAYPFGQIGSTLLTLTTHSDAAVRIAALKVLTHYRTPEAIACLLRALRDQDEMVRFWGTNGLLYHARWFVEQRDMTAVEPLIAALGDSSWKVRRYVISCLCMLDDLRAVQPLISMLNDTHEEVRLAATFALGSLKDPRAVEPLIVALNKDTSRVRSNAANALGKLRDPRAVEPLIAALDHIDLSVRRNVVMALGLLKDPRAIEPLAARVNDPDRWVRHQAVLVLSELGGPQVVEPLITALNDTDQTIRDNAAKALGELRDPRATEPLIAVLSRPFLQFQVVLALKALGDPRAIEPLRKLLLSWKLAPQARETILGSLLSLLQQHDPLEASRISKQYAEYVGENSLSQSPAT